jgi:hypothetical protein
LKEEKNRKKKQKDKNKGKVFWISKFDPRIPHPREVLSQNFNILEGDPIAKKIFQRKNLVAGSKRGKNIQELISPTVQQHKVNTRKHGPSHVRGSYQCENFKSGRKCELCNHVKEGEEFVVSKHFNTKHAVRGHQVHVPKRIHLKICGSSTEFMTSTVRRVMWAQQWTCMADGQSINRTVTGAPYQHAWLHILL